MKKKTILITFPLLAALIILSVGSFDNAKASTNRPAMMSSFELSAQKWKKRVLLVFAPSRNHAAYQQQMQLLQEYKSDLRDRDLVLVEVLTNGESYVDFQPIDSSSATGLRNRLQVSNQDFCVILVGKDGGVKRRDKVPVEAKAIFAFIDAMPMRQQEMREKGTQ